MAVEKGPKQRWSGYFSLCPFPSWKGVFSQNGPQRSRARRCCAAKRTLHGEDGSEILDKRERGGPKWTAKMAQSLTASDTDERCQWYIEQTLPKLRRLSQTWCDGSRGSPLTPKP